MELKVQPKSTLMQQNVEEMLKEYNLKDFQERVVAQLMLFAQQLVEKSLRDAELLKNGDSISREDITLALKLERHVQNMSLPMNVTNLCNLAMECNDKPLVIKEMHGIKIPKENLGSCNYQLENPNKKLKLENLTNKPIGGNCFTFLIPPKHYKTPNMGGFMLSNNNPRAVHEIPMKITIRPKLNIQR